MHTENIFYMVRRVEIPQEQYLKLKNQVLENEILTKFDVSLAEIEITDLKSVIIKGQSVPLNKEAIQGLVQALGISATFIDTLRKGFGDENKEVLNAIIRNIKSHKVKNLTFIFHKRLGEITNIYTLCKKVIEDNQSFDALEKVISRAPGSYLRNITQASNGDLKAVIANPQLEFQFGNMPDECFTSGMTLDLTAKQMLTSFFTERLVCTNGCTTQNKLMSKEVNTSEKVPEFLTAILDADYHINSIEAFKRRINTCYHTRASLGEILQVDGRLVSLLGNYAPILTDQMSVNRFRVGFPEEYLADKGNHKYFQTDITLWDLVNEITAISSRIEQHRIAVSEKTNLGLQIMGGNLMFREPDLAPSTIKQIYR